MIYLEDIIELIEDVPDELQRRGGLIQDWERQASEYKNEADKLTARLHNDDTLRDDEKANIYRQIGEMHVRARDVSQKKYEMAHKCHQLLQALSDRVSDWSYHCKLELEVDAPGSTGPIESSFVSERLMVAAAAANNRTQGGQQPSPAFRVPEEKPARDRVGSSSMSRESTPMIGGRAEAGGGRMAYSKSRTRDSSLSSSRASSVSAFELPPAVLQQQQQQQRKRKRDRQRERERQLQQYEQSQAAAAVAQQLQSSRHQSQQQQAPSRGGSSRGGDVPVLKDPMSTYMRRKKEKEREERKLREAHRLASQQARAPPPTAEAAAAARYAARVALERGHVHANRERSSQQRVVKPEPIDDGYEQQVQPARRAGPGRPPGSRAMNALLAQQHQQQQPMPQPRREEQPLQPERREELVDDTISGGMDDDDDDLLKFLNDEMPGGIAHEDLNLALDDENIYDFDHFGKELGTALENIQTSGRPPSPLGDHHTYGTLNATSKSSAAGPSRYQNKSDPRLNPSNAELKRQQALHSQQQAQSLQQPQQQLKFFGAGESLHGRQRKLTARAEIHAIDLDQKERKRRQKEEEMERGEYGRRESRDVSMANDSLGGGDAMEEDSDMTPYCYCNQPSDGTMVGCEGRRCPYGGWFHLACLEMLVAPTVDNWYCDNCREHRQWR